MSHFSNAINAAASALDAQRVRMEIAVSNMANAETTRDAVTGEVRPYRRRDVVMQTAEPRSFGAALDAASGVGEARGVAVSVVEDPTPGERRWAPGHQDAVDGWVTLPNVNVADEMVNLMTATRAYQANLSAITMIRESVQKSLELAK